MRLCRLLRSCLRSYPRRNADDGEEHKRARERVVLGLREFPHT